MKFEGLASHLEELVEWKNWQDVPVGCKEHNLSYFFLLEREEVEGGLVSKLVLSRDRERI